MHSLQCGDDIYFETLITKGGRPSSFGLFIALIKRTSQLSVERPWLHRVL